MYVEISMSDDKSSDGSSIGTVYLAGGCFWGIEKLMGSVRGVIDTECGYANGISADKANYIDVCRGGTGFRETVRVAYDKRVVSLDAILFVFFRNIDPTVENEQGNDVGAQYQTGIYYTDDDTGREVERIAAVEKQRHECFLVEIGKLKSFYAAEEYHQHYLDKKPNGYCHIPKEAFDEAKDIVVDPGRYARPSNSKIVDMLTPIQYGVTQESGTEPPFHNEYWNSHERGIYVDVVTGEPLFSSKDKFDSRCGWPAFSSVMDENTVVPTGGRRSDMPYKEVRSRSGDSHLGHVFFDDPDSPNGIRYCINSASLRFIPYAEMDELGYGYLKRYV
jgi:peptide methionine sulfoxide reductase msrA/msrB